MAEPISLPDGYLGFVKDDEYDWEEDCKRSYAVAIAEIARRVKAGEPIENFPFLLAAPKLKVVD